MSVDMDDDLELRNTNNAHPHMEHFLKVGGECRDLNVRNVWYAATCSLFILRMLTCKLRYLN